MRLRPRGGFLTTLKNARLGPKLFVYKINVMTKRFQVAYSLCGAGVSLRHDAKRRGAGATVDNRTLEDAIIKVVHHARS